MISRTFRRLPPPLTTTLLHHLTHLPPPSFCYSTETSATTSGGTVPNIGLKIPRPSTITWSPRLQNSVSLIGAVLNPLKQCNTSKGKFGVYTTLRVKVNADSNAFFSISLSMWDELAEKAMLHVKQNDFIYVSGELGSFTKKTLEGTEIVIYKVTAREFNHVELNEPGKKSERAVNSGVDTTGENLGESAVQKFNSRLHLLQVFFANPEEWYDNRKNKKNPKVPDFKHKSTGEAIWLHANDPPWVKEQLKLLDSRRSGGRDSDMTFNFSTSLVYDEQ